MTWIAVIIAGLFEVVGVTGIQMITNGNKKSGFTLVIGGFIVSLILLSIAMEAIPLGVAYAVWTGIGTVGSAIVGIIFYNESADRLRLIFISLVIIAIIGLRLVS